MSQQQSLFVQSKHIIVYNERQIDTHVADVIYLRHIILYRGVVFLPPHSFIILDNVQFSARLFKDNHPHSRVMRYLTIKLEHDRAVRSLR